MQTLKIHNLKTLFTALLCLPACLAVLPASAEKSARARQPQAQQTVIRAQGHPKHIDFVARSSKRADLRANIQRKGLDVAFTEWLREEHAHVYKEYASNLARQKQNVARANADKPTAQ